MRREKGKTLEQDSYYHFSEPRGFEKLVLGTTNVCTVLLAEKSHLNTRQAGREQIIIKGALFPWRWGALSRKNKPTSQWDQKQMSSWKSHIPFTSSYMETHLLHIYFPDSQALQPSTEILKK